MARFVSISRKRSIEEIKMVIKLLGIFKKTFFFERSINYSRIHPNKNSFSSVLPTSQIQFILYCSLVQIWVNSKIVYDA